VIIIYFLWQVIDQVIAILGWAIIIRALLSWIPNLPYNAFVRIIHEITDPLLKPFERLQFGGPGFAIGFAPLFAYLALLIIRSVLRSIFFGLMY